MDDDDNSFAATVDPPKHGRAKGTKNGSVEPRVRHLMMIMQLGDYISGVTPMQLAKEWKIEPRSVVNLACEASRRLRALRCDDDQLIEICKGTLQKIRVLATKEKKYNEAMAATKTLLALIGAHAEQLELNAGPAGRPTIIIQEAAPPPGRALPPSEPDDG
jgi:hypothetical protein